MFIWAQGQLQGGASGEEQNGKAERRKEAGSKEIKKNGENEKKKNAEKQWGELGFSLLFQYPRVLAQVASNQVRNSFPVNMKQAPKQGP